MKDNEPEDSEQMKQVSGLYVGTGLGITAKLWTCWMYFTVKFVFSFFVIDEKKNYFDEKPFDLFWTPYLCLSK